MAFEQISFSGGIRGALWLGWHVPCRTCFPNNPHHWRGWLIVKVATLRSDSPPSPHTLSLFAKEDRKVFARLLPAVQSLDASRI